MWLYLQQRRLQNQPDGNLLISNNYHYGKCLVSGHPLGPQNISINVIKHNNGYAQHSERAITEHPGRNNDGQLYMIDVAPSITSIQPQTGSIHGGTLITMKGTSFGTDRKTVIVEIDGLPCNIVDHAPDTITCRLGYRNHTQTKLKLYFGNRGSTFDIYQNIISTDINTFKNHVRFPNEPSSKKILRGFSNFEIPTQLDNYGGKIYGWFVVPKTANYSKRSLSLLPFFNIVLIVFFFILFFFFSFLLSKHLHFVLMIVANYLYHQIQIQSIKKASIKRHTIHRHGKTYHLLEENYIKMTKFILNCCTKKVLVVILVK